MFILDLLKVVWDATIGYFINLGINAVVGLVFPE